MQGERRAVSEVCAVVDAPRPRRKEAAQAAVRVVHPVNNNFPDNNFNNNFGNNFLARIYLLLLYNTVYR